MEEGDQVEQVGSGGSNMVGGTVLGDWWIPSPFLAMNFATGLSSAVGSRSSTSVSFRGRKAVLIFCSATSSTPVQWILSVPS